VIIYIDIHTHTLTHHLLSSQRILMAQIWPSFLLLVSATLLLACHHASCSASKFNNATDLQALLSFKSMLSDGSMTSWNNSIHFCEWPGITCGGG